MLEKLPTRLLRIGDMHRSHGTAWTVLGKMRECGDCAMFVTCRVGRRVVHKCLIVGDTMSAASDWRVHYGACGLFKQAGESK